MAELSQPVEVSAIARPMDRFFCPVYSANLSAAFCTSRQRAAREAGPESKYGKCFDCSIGRQVAQQIDAPAAASLFSPCAQDGCGGGAIEGQYCAMHARVRRIYRKDPPRMAPKHTEIASNGQQFKTNAELALLAGVSGSAVTQNRALQAARDGALYDLRHPAVQQWLERRRGTARAAPEPVKARAKPAAKKPAAEAPADREPQHKTQAQLARLGRCSAAAVRQHRAMKAARTGDLYDLRHPAVVAWLEGRGVDADTTLAPTTKKVAKPEPTRKVKPKARPNGAVTDVRGELQRVIEAVELVETIGWELARALARGIRAST